MLYLIVLYVKYHLWCRAVQEVLETGMVAHACNPNPEELEAGGVLIEMSLGYSRVRLKPAWTM
jgi:hypothetical protein